MKRHNCYYTYILGLVVCCLYTTLPSVAQTGQFYSTENGLSSSLVNQIFQDSHGFIWTATEYGLNKFDGLHFTTYYSHAKDSTSLKNNYVRTMFEDNRHNLFIGCIGGLCRYDRSTDSFVEIPMYRDSAQVYSHVTRILQLRNGEVWLTTSGQGVFTLDKNLTKAVCRQEIVDQLDFYNFHSLYEDCHGCLWIGSEQFGLVRYHLKEKTLKLYRSPALADSHISCIRESAEGVLFVGTQKEGLMRYDRANDAFIPLNLSDGQRRYPVFCLSMVDGRLLVGTDGMGVKVYNVHRDCLDNFPLNSGAQDFSTGKVHSILSDRDGNLWLGLFQKGVALFPTGRNQFGYYGERMNRHNPIGTGCVMGFYRDQQRHLWVATDNDGLFELDAKGKRVRHYAPSDAPDGVPAVVTCIHPAADGSLWLGSYDRGVARLDKRTGRCSYPLKMDNDKVFSIAEDAHGDLYISTLGAGFYHYKQQSGELVHYKASRDDGNDFRRDNLPNGWLNSLYCDSEGLVWIAHYRGVSCFDPKKETFLRFGGTNRQVCNCVAYALQEDSSGKIWAGTSDGLFCFDKQTGEPYKYTTADGLPSNVICGILEGPSGELWLSTYMGLSRFDVKNKRFVNYYLGDGLQGNEFAHGSCYRDSNGTFYFGGVSGITFFRPQDIVNVSKGLQVNITEFSIFNQPIHRNTLSGGRPVIEGEVDEADEFRLCHSDNTFSISFSTFLFNTPEQISYQYCMEELGRQWLVTDPGVNRVTYNNLPPGKYTFSVRAVNRGNVSPVRTISILVSPPWYQTVWAYLIYLLLVCLLCWGIVSAFLSRMRHRREMMKREHAEQLNEAKLQFFINISHEIRTPMTLIINPLEKLLQEHPEGEIQKTYLMMYRNAQRILRLINQLMDIRKLDKGQMFMKFRETDMVGFIEDVMQTFEYTARKKHIRFTFLHEMPQLKAWVDLNNFDKVLMNILSNAFKYTPDEGEIQLTLATGTDSNRRDALHDYFEIVVQDSGIGIDRSKIDRIFERFYQIDNDITKSNFGTGIGLHLSRSLVELHHGVIRAENRTDAAGSRFIIRIPMGSAHLRADELEPMDESHLSTAKVPARMVPLSDENLSDGATPDEKQPNGKGHFRLLIAEDEEEIRNYLRSELADKYRILTCTNGQEAYEQILKEMPDLVISDVMMPEMDGMVLCSKIKQNTNINHIPVILLTAKTRNEDQQEGLKAGADAYIVKPFNTEVLKSVVANLLSNRRMLRNKFSGAQQQVDKIEKLAVRSGDEQLMERIMRVVNEHLNDPHFSAEDLAAEVGLSRVHVHRKLKELTNLSTRDFIKNIRLQQAALLLTKDKKLTVSEIAYTVGYTNPSHFSSSFKEKYGVSPKDYVAQQSEENKE